MLFNFLISAALMSLVVATFAAANPIADPERLRISIIVEEAEEWTSLTQAAADGVKGQFCIGSGERCRIFFPEQCCSGRCPAYVCLSRGLSNYSDSCRF